MKNLKVASSIGREGTMPQGLTGPSTSIASTRVAFLDNLRYLMVVLVVVHHSVAAYAIVAPHWIVHDTNTFAADIIRELFDVFMMPVLFFVAGYFALPLSGEERSVGISQGQGQAAVGALGTGCAYHPSSRALRPTRQARPAVLEVLAVIPEQL